jgi:hypothetical protein
MLDWVESQSPSVRAGYRKIHDQSIVRYPEPIGLEQHADTFQAIRRRRLLEAYVGVVPGGYLCGYKDDLRTAVLTPSGELIWDASVFAPESGNVADHWLFGNSKLPEPTFLSEAIGVLAIHPNYEGQYFHWLFQILPCIHLFRASGIPIDRYVVSKRSYPGRYPFQAETLATLGLDESELITVEPPFSIRAAELVVPSNIRLLSPALACAFLRRAFLKEGGPRPGRERLYLSRRTLTGRTIVNEDEVKEVLARFNFREVIPHEMSVAEQAMLLASAAAIAGPHGGALSNIVFCKPETTVIEFFAPTYVHPAYWMLSSQCHLRYHYLVGKGDRPPSWEAFPAPAGNRDPIEVDPDQLVKLLKVAGL